MRALRSIEWYPQSPDDGATGAWGAASVHDGAGERFVDGSLECDTEYYYSLFARRRDGGWFGPVRIRAHPPVPTGPESGKSVAHGGRAWQIEGDLRSTPRAERRIETLAIVYPAVFMAAALLAAATNGIAYHASQADHVLLAGQDGSGHALRRAARDRVVRWLRQAKHPFNPRWDR